MPLSGVQKRPKLTIASAVITFLSLAVLIAACAGQPAYPPQPGNEQPPGFFPTDPITEQGVATQNLYTLTFWIAVAVFAIVEGLLLWIAFRYRRRPTDTELPKQTHGSNPLELLWTIIPTITVTVLFIAVLITLTEQHTVSADEPDLVVDVTGFQWQWTFDYPEQGLSFTGTGRTGPTMALPVNETVRIRLHANDVIHAFYVPQFLYKQDVVPGRVNEFDLNITNPGIYGGQCAEFCGLAHADMHFTVHAMTRAEFDAWVVEQQQAIPTPGPSAPPDAAVVEVTALRVAPPPGFEQATISAPADQPWVINLTNADPNVPHDVSIRRANPDGSDWLGDPDAPGGGTATYQPPPLTAGTYEFFCSLHPTTMVGTLNVGQ